MTKQTRDGRPRGRFFYIRLALSVLLCLALGSALAQHKSYSFSQWYWIMEQGDIGSDVTELQSRLAFLGFYGGTVDGHFGPSTRRAVMGFQKEFGMQADGRVGPDTKTMLAKATAGWTPGYRPKPKTGPSVPPSSSRFSSSEIKILARAVYGESRGEPYLGQVAVAAVILNRIDNPAFPNTISGVVFQPGAFTAVDDGQIWLEPDKDAYQAARDAINGWDPSGGATYYFNPVTATSKWIWSRPQIKQIGEHIFCR